MIDARRRKDRRVSGWFVHGSTPIFDGSIVL
jgi:hypothetical protein